jgi:hypothetical protein
MAGGKRLQDRVAVTVIVKGGCRMMLRSLIIPQSEYIQEMINVIARQIISMMGLCNNCRDNWKGQARKSLAFKVL